ncbi:MAG: SEC-C metal-binding domain-containing protein [Candidatus Marinimicrobia bacterium]|nr:SEC-C metal-binding domain-containing protein [Candidatus Neomarinimicrobiota bacterium]
MTQIRRNDPCHCGSGKKYKNCHQKYAGKFGKNWVYIIGAVVIAGILLVIYILFSSGVTDNPPPGKVWSPEHGHWHSP